MAGSAIPSRTFQLYPFDSALWRQKDQTRSQSAECEYVPSSPREPLKR
jgi:hypothetical protein